MWQECTASRRRRAYVDARACRKVSPVPLFWYLRAPLAPGLDRNLSLSAARTPPPRFGAAGRITRHDDRHTAANRDAPASQPRSAWKGPLEPLRPRNLTERVKFLGSRVNYRGPRPSLG